MMRTEFNSGLADRLKPRKCKNKSCGKKFQPTEDHPFKLCCGTDCELAIADLMLAKAKVARAKVLNKQRKVERVETKLKLESHKPLAYWLKKAEKACNAYIRARDPNVCISCGVTHSSAWQAGHFISVGANPTLRFNEQNIHKQCVQCNMFNGGNPIPYRVNLIQKIGSAAVEFLESWHPPVKMTREMAEEIEAMYMAKLKNLSSLTQHN